MSNQQVYTSISLWRDVSACEHYIMTPFYLRRCFNFYCSHPPQNISPPLIVTIIPVNDNGPVVTLATTEVFYNESLPPILIFPGLIIMDADNTPCNQQILRSAQVTVETRAMDTNVDDLMVRNVLSLICV